MTNNPRRANGTRRDKARARVLAREDVCALCGHPVDKSLRTPHPMSAEVDEIVPVSRGGSPYDMSNLQLTHRICNQRKGNRIAMTAQSMTAVINQPLPKSRKW